MLSIVLVIILHRNIYVCEEERGRFSRECFVWLLAFLEARTEREIAERDLNNDGYQTVEGEENVESTSADDLEHSEAVVEVIETSNVSSSLSFSSHSNHLSSGN